MQSSAKDDRKWIEMHSGQGLDLLVARQDLVQGLWDAVNTSAGQLVYVAPLVRRVLGTDAWRERKLLAKGGKIVKFDRFVDFIETDPLEGCGWPREKVEALIRDDQDTLRLWRQAITPPVGAPGHGNSDNVTITRGNSRAYTLDRLDRERPDLYAEVVAKRMSANAAAIEAGFRKKPGPVEQFKSIWKRATPEERSLIRELIDSS